MIEKKEKVVVGFSGGVDSASAVKFLRDQGYQPIAVFLKMFDNQNLNEIKKLADKLKVDLIVKNTSKIFSKCVIGSFLKEYQNNQTPNPCVWCNVDIKFKTLLEVADEIGADKIATGHYAQIRKNGKNFDLLKGKDEKKDQSYFLYRLTQKELSRTLLPLGDKSKEEIKRQALKNGWFKKIEESQDVCFLENQERVQDFLKDNLDLTKNKSGNIEDEEGNILGKHKGLVYYTQGQRKGLDLAGGPFYVVGKNLKKNILLVTRDKNNLLLVNDKILIRQVSWVNQEPTEGKEYQFKSRYRSQLIPGKFKKNGSELEVYLEKPQWAVAVGQSLVAYDGEKVIGGGVVREIKI